MEEDIKMLEKDITCNKRQMKEIGSYIPFDINLMKRVENLIKGYRELQETADKLLGQNEWYKDYYDCESIPKSKMKEKREELKKNEDCGYCNNACPKYARCMMLQELMEEQ